MHHRPVYGLDIETDTSPDQGGVPDPRVARVRTVALSMPSGDRTFVGAEPELLGELDDVLRQLQPGILATWNGAAFDLPYLADRAEMWGLHLGLRLAADRHLRVRGEVLRGHAGAYRAGWYGHRHLDASRLYRSGRRPLLDVDDLLRSLGLRSARRRPDGAGPADAPETELTHKAVHAFAANDARLVRVHGGAAASCGGPTGRPDRRRTGVDGATGGRRVAAERPDATTAVSRAPRRARHARRAALNLPAPSRSTLPHRGVNEARSG